MIGPGSGNFDSEASQGRENTALHNAIIKNEKTLALSLIAADQRLYQEEKKSSIINAKSLGNTPLMLALKTGNMEIAEAILSHPGVNAALTDDRGLSPLHWACMLRQDKIINLLLEKEDVYPHQAFKWWEDKPHIIDDAISPFRLYISPIPFLPMSSHIGFEDSKTLRIRKAEAYTDIIFHMRSLCNNLGWKSGDLDFTFLGQVKGSSKFLRACDVFANNFKIGIASFITSRNAIPYNKELAGRLVSTDDELNMLKKIPDRSSVETLGVFAGKTAAATPSDAQTEFKPPKIS